MSVYVIYYNKDRAKMMRPVLTREEYLALRNSEEQKATVKAVRNGDTRKKSRLVQMNYSCLPNGDGTLKGSVTMSTTVGMDIDHVPAEQMQAVRERILSRKDELGLLMLELSARGQGYHMVFRRKAEKTQEENLLWASQLIGVQYDEGAKDITRVFYTTTGSKEDLIYLDDEVFERKTLSNSPCLGVSTVAFPIPTSSTSTGSGQVVFLWTGSVTSDSINWRSISVPLWRMSLRGY